MFYAAVYDAETIVNWDSDPYIGPDGQRRVTLVVLNEARYERQPGDEWEVVQYYRKLELTEDGFYEQSTYRDENELTRVRPLIADKPLGRIPFYFLNAKHVLPETDPPPLEGLASLCLAIYRGEADLRQLLHMSAQDTLVVPGGDPETKYRTGAGAVITPPVDSKVHYASVSTSGLSEMRHVLEADKKLAAVRGAQLIDTTSRQRESGDALRIRVAAQTATLHQIALASAEAIKELLKEAARWMGVNESEVEQIEVLPNVDFTAETVTGKDMLDMVTAKVAGFPISLETMWDYARRGGVGDRTFAEEQELIDVEPPLDMQEPQQPSTDTNTGQDVTGGSQNSQ